jgi:hypothetical protein
MLAVLSWFPTRLTDAIFRAIAGLTKKQLAGRPSSTTHEAGSHA